MIKLKSLIFEETAAETAKKHGFVHKGFGWYALKNGKIVARSVGGKLKLLKKGEKIDKVPDSADEKGREQMRKAMRRLDKRLESTRPLTEQQSRKYIKGLGFDPERVVWHEEGVKPFKVGNVQYNTAGSYHPATDEIHLFKEARGNQRGLIIHEVTHAKYHLVMQQIQDEFREANAHDMALPLRSKETYFRIDGRLRDDRARAKFPTLAALEWAQEGYFNKKGDWVNGAAELRSEDGVSPYSAQYWKVWEAHEGPLPGDPLAPGMWTPVNESLAEAARMKLEGSTDVFKKRPHLRKLLKTINAEYKRLKAAGVRTRRADEPTPTSTVGSK